MGTYRRRWAACPQGPTYCTYWVRVPASAVPYVPRTVAPQVAAELRHIRKCDADMPNATLDVRFGTCYINPEATCKFSSALLPETLHTTNRPGCSTLLAASM